MSVASPNPSEQGAGSGEIAYRFCQEWYCDRPWKDTMLTFTVPTSSTRAKIVPWASYYMFAKLAHPSPNMNQLAPIDRTWVTLLKNPVARRHMSPMIQQYVNSIEKFLACVQCVVGTLSQRMWSVCCWRGCWSRGTHVHDRRMVICCSILLVETSLFEYWLTTSSLASTRASEMSKMFRRRCRLFSISATERWYRDGELILRFSCMDIDLVAESLLCLYQFGLQSFLDTNIEMSRIRPPHWKGVWHRQAWEDRTFELVLGLIQFPDRRDDMIGMPFHCYTCNGAKDNILDHFLSRSSAPTTPAKDRQHSRLATPATHLSTECQLDHQIYWSRHKHCHQIWYNCHLFSVVLCVLWLQRRVEYHHVWPCWQYWLLSLWDLLDQMISAFEQQLLCDRLIL